MSKSTLLRIKILNMEQTVSLSLIPEIANVEKSKNLDHREN